MRIHYLQHVPFEGLGSIASWKPTELREVTATRFFEKAELPAPGAIDFLVVMGGPMSVHDHDKFPWLIPERDFIRSCIEAEKPVLGVCLGAQLIASALGAKVYPNHTKEIGWFPVRAEPWSGNTFRFPESLDVFHWHGETFELPEGAIRLARSEACANQAFQFGRRVVGLQFHLETTPEAARDIVTHGRSELQPSTYIQSEDELLAAPPETYQRVNQWMNDLLSYLWMPHKSG